uniref:tRNA-uridine aminocarboxypropyltransferase 1 n=1 Tax=Leptobrachium leishanense TaxID=445787 RepID=A0A8C5MCG6_9ANUR
MSSENPLKEKRTAGLASCRTTASLENDLLQMLQISSHDVLAAAQKKGRSKCPKCKGSRMFYCYTCYVPVESVPTEEIPHVKLPLKIDIIKHPNENDGKSTAAHAKLLAQDAVTVHTFPCIPDYHEQKNEIILVFPGKDSVSLKDSILLLNNYEDKNKASHVYEPPTKQTKLSTEHDTGEKQENGKVKLKGLKKVVFIDSTWNQTNKIIADERLQDLVTVELTERKTCFWRHQKGSPDTYLSTIEAIYYFMTDQGCKAFSRETLTPKTKG